MPPSIYLCYLLCLGHASLPPTFLYLAKLWLIFEGSAQVSFLGSHLPPSGSGNPTPQNAVHVFILALTAFQLKLLLIDIWNQIRFPNILLNFQH